MSTLLNITKGFNKRLASISPSIEIAYEAVSFTPVAGVPYQRVQLIPARPQNPTLGQNYYREKGTYQILLCYPGNLGTTDILDRAELTRSFFKQGTSFTEAGTTVIVVGTPYVGGANIVQDRLVLPIIINYTAEVLG